MIILKPILNVRYVELDLQPHHNGVMIDINGQEIEMPLMIAAVIEKAGLIYIEIW